MDEANADPYKQKKEADATDESDKGMKSHPQKN